MVFNKKEKSALLAEIRKGLISHAYVVEGIRGVGKKTFALEMAKAILCTGDNVPCGSCGACIKCEAGMHPDLHLYSCEGTSFKIDKVREIKRLVNMRANDGKRAVFILDGAHNMTVAAQNALLKVFEEPPEGTVFFLLTEKKEALLPTVRSRGRILRLSAADSEDIRGFLKEKFPTKKDADIAEAVRMAEGSAGKAEAVLNKEGKSERDAALKLCAVLYGENDRYALYTAFLAKTKKRDSILPVADNLTVAARDVLVYKLSCGKCGLLTEEQAASFAATNTAQSLYDIFEALLEYGRSLRRNTDPGIAAAELCGRISRAKG